MRQVLVAQNEQFFEISEAETIRQNEQFLNWGSRSLFLQKKVNETLQGILLVPLDNVPHSLNAPCQGRLDIGKASRKCFVLRENFHGLVNEPV